MTCQERKYAMRWKMAIAWSGIGLVFCCLALGGCAPQRRVQYYAINLPPAGTATMNSSGVALVVGRIELAPALQDGGIRYRSGKRGLGPMVARSCRWQSWLSLPSMDAVRVDWTVVSRSSFASPAASRRD
jgi:uncharacterized lipoprotein YmbA